MVIMSGWNCNLNNHTHSQQYWNSNNVDVSRGYGFSDSHTLFQCEYSSTFNNNDDDTERSDVVVSSGYGF